MQQALETWANRSQISTGVRSPQMAQRLATRETPDAAIVGQQRWNHLLFAHWKIEPALVQATLPPGLFVDSYEGAAYLGIVPFFMERIRPAWLPPLPWVSWFLELNVRTYVHDREGRPGVWFYSLDCNQPIAVAVARRFFHLPYFHARMNATREGDLFTYQSQRRGDAIEAQYVWRAIGETREAQPGSLEFFLVERYLLFTTHRDGSLCSGRVHHQPYRLHAAELSACATHPAMLAGFELKGPPASVLCAPALDVSVYALEKNATATG